MEKRLTIGIITARVAEPEQRQLLNGILRRARLHDVDTVIFSNMYNFEKYFAKTEVENRIYNLVLSERIDGLILTAESFYNKTLQDYIYERIVRKQVPTIVTAASLPGMCCINTDVAEDFEELAHHLAEVHGFTDIDVLTGHEHLETSHERVEGFRRGLEAHGQTLPEDHVIYGNFWMNTGEALAMDYIEGRRRMPQAVVCANDYMAYGIIDVLLAHGVAVPDTVSVFGYEYIGKRYYHSPILTTFQRNRSAMGEKAVETLLEQITGKPGEDISTKGFLIPGDSCPCHLDKKILSEELLAIRQEQNYNRMNQDANFEQQLTVCRSIEDYIRVLQEFVYLIRNCKGLYLCLYEDWCSSGGCLLQDEDDGKAPMLCYRIMSPEPYGTQPHLYQRGQLYPDPLPGSPQHNILYFTPIFFAGRELGYFILEYDEPDGYDLVYHSWLKIAANGLEALRMKNDIHMLLECRNLSEYHDTSTGLYTETGFFDELAAAQHAGGSVAMLLLRAPLFSDNTSIDKRHVSVRVEMQIAECLKKLSTGEHMFSAKLGDRLFALAGVGSFTEEDCALLADKLCVLVLHAPQSGEQCSPDTIQCLHMAAPAGDTDVRAMAKQLYAQMEDDLQDLSRARSQLGYAEYAAMRNAMFRSPEQEWNAQDTCRSFHLSYGHFRATYKELFGISFHQDLIRSRIQYAKYLLLTTSQSLQAIAYQCGYEDYKYFLRQFRQLTQITPNAYRSG